MVWRLTAMIILSPSILILAALLLLSLMFHWPLWIFSSVLILSLLSVLILVVIIPIRRYNRWSYAIQEQSIELHHGIWLWKRTMIPMVRVQHVDMKQGPLLRRYGLASITISTAAGSHQIPALTVQTAEQVQRQVMAYAEVSDEDL
ncbi:PH domain-containing protein [Paenibacillus sp. 481]|nr:PH domain-containing protein [Paenibacillus sp. 481]